MISKRVGAVVVLMGLAVLLLIGCSSPPPPSAPSKTTPAAAPTPAAKQEATPVAKPTTAATRETSPATPAGATAVAKPTTAPAASPAPAAETSLQWFGQAGFLLTGSAGTKVLLDPFGAQVGYTVPALKGVDAVTVTHEHADHNNVAAAGEGATIVRGLSGNDWASIDQTVKGIKMKTVGVFHDNKEGAERGKNAVFVFEVDGMKVAHLGDLGHELTPAQVSAIGPVDVLMIPVGGFYTIDAAGATKVVGQLSPKTVIPMHYRTPKFSPNNPVSGVDDFLKDKKVERVNGNIYKFSKTSLPQSTTVFVLNYE